MRVIIRIKGGPGSGHHGHHGIPGKRGGSLPGIGGVQSEYGIIYVKRGSDADDIASGVESLLETLPVHISGSLDGAKIFVGRDVRVLGAAQEDIAYIRDVRPSVLNHEIGHLVNTMYGRKMGVTAISRKREWRNAIGGERLIDFRLSRIAKYEEDFAGAFDAYTSRPNWLLQKYPKHHAAMVSLFGDTLFSSVVKKQLPMGNGSM